MKLEIATSLLFSFIFQGAAEEHKTAAQAFASTHQKIDARPKTQTATVENKPSSERKFNKRILKQRKERAIKAHNASQQSSREDSTELDLGVLATKPKGPRFLQEDDYEYYCPRDTCPTELCDCADAGGDLSDCSNELKSVCAAGKLADCVFEDYVQVYSEVYCPFVSCLGDGFQSNQCDCAFYEMYCQKLESDECKAIMASDDPDSPHVFGCDPTEMEGVCEEARSCRERGDLNGLPELGQWQGTSMIGIKNSAERHWGNAAGGGSVVAGITALSMLWCFMNI